MAVRLRLGSGVEYCAVGTAQGTRRRATTRRGSSSAAPTSPRRRSARRCREPDARARRERARPASRTARPVRRPATHAGAVTRQTSSVAAIRPIVAAQRPAPVTDHGRRGSRCAARATDRAPATAASRARRRAGATPAIASSAAGDSPASQAMRACTSTAPDRSDSLHVEHRLLSPRRPTVAQRTVAVCNGRRRGDPAGVDCQPRCRAGTGERAAPERRGRHSASRARRRFSPSAAPCAR